MSSNDLQRHIGKFYGKYSGQVISNEDTEKRGRIMVSVPTIFGPADSAAVCARPCLPYGHFYIPHVGAKVWVEFEAGDLRYPLWVGTWYLPNAVPQQAAVTPPANRVIHTPAGHTIEMNDTEGEEKIIIRHKTNAFISIDKDGSILITNPNGSHLHLNAADQNATLMEQHGNLITMNSEGTLIVNHAGTTLEMQNNSLRIIAGGTVQLSANDVILDSGTVSLTQNATQAAIAGDIFALMFDTHTHPTAMGPSGPPVLPISNTPALSKVVKLK